MIFPTKIKQAIALLIAIVFSFTNTFFSVPEALAGNPGAGVLGQPLIPPFQIPAELGEVTEIAGARTRRDAPVIIHIQAIHRQYESQKNIQAILNILSKQYGIRLLLLEGAANKLQPELFRSTPARPDLDRKITNSMMKKGELTGAEAFLIDDDEKAEGWGIENVEAYRKNYEALKKVIAHRKETDEYLAKLYSDIEKTQFPKLNPNLRDFLRRKLAQQTMEWLSYLSKTAEKQAGIDFENPASQYEWPMLVRYYKLEKAAARIDPKKLEKEKERFNRFLVGAGLPRLTGAETAPLQPRFFFERLLDQLPEDFHFDRYPNLRLHIQQIIFRSELRGERFFQEQERLSQRLTEAMAKTAAEKEVLHRLADYRLLAKLLRLKLMRGEWEKIEWRIRNGEFGMKNKELNVLFNSAIRIPQSAFAFYTAAVSRESHMMKNALERMRALKQKKAILITGGFHTPGLKQSIADAGLSYIQVTPKTSSVSQDHNEIYLRAMLGQGALNLSQLEPPLRTDLRFWLLFHPAARAGSLGEYPDMDPGKLETDFHLQDVPDSVRLGWPGFVEKGSITHPADTKTQTRDGFLLKRIFTSALQESSVRPPESNRIDPNPRAREGVDRPAWMMAPDAPLLLFEFPINERKWRILAERFPTLWLESLLIPEHDVNLALTDELAIYDLLTFHRTTGIKGYVNSLGFGSTRRLHDHLYFDELPIGSLGVTSLREVDGVRIGELTDYPGTTTVFESDNDFTLSRWIGIQTEALLAANIPHHVFFYPGKVIFIWRDHSLRKLWTVETRDLGGYSVQPLVFGGLLAYPERILEKISPEDYNRIVSQLTVPKADRDEILRSMLGREAGSLPTGQAGASAGSLGEDQSREELREKIEYFRKRLARELEWSETAENMFYRTSRLLSAAGILSLFWILSHGSLEALLTIVSFVVIAWLVQQIAEDILEEERPGNPDWTRIIRARLPFVITRAMDRMNPDQELSPQALKKIHRWLWEPMWNQVPRNERRLAVVYQRLDSQIFREVLSGESIPLEKVKDYVALLRNVIPDLSGPEEADASSLGTTGTIKKLTGRIEEIEAIVANFNAEGFSSWMRDQLSLHLTLARARLELGQILDAAQLVRRFANDGWVREFFAYEGVPRQFRKRLEDLAKDIERASIPKELRAWLRKALRKKRESNADRRRSFHALIETLYPGVRPVEIVRRVVKADLREFLWVPYIKFFLRDKILEALAEFINISSKESIRAIGTASLAGLIHHFAMLGEPVEGASLGKLPKWMEIPMIDSIHLNSETGRIAYLSGAPEIPLGFGFWIVPPAETGSDSVSGIFQGPTNDPVLNRLTPAGRERADKAARHLIASLRDEISAGKRLVVVTSRLDRDRDTAARFVDLIRENPEWSVEVAEEELANEIDFGPANNKTPGELNGTQQAIASRYRKGLDATAFFQPGENFMDLLARTKRLLEKLNEDYGEQDALWKRGERNTIVVLFAGSTLIEAVRALLHDPVLLDRRTRHIDWIHHRIPPAKPTQLIRSIGGQALSLGAAHTYQEIGTAERDALIKSFNLADPDETEIVILKDEEGRLFMVKKKHRSEDDDDYYPYQDDPKREMLAYLIGKDRVNTVEIRLLSPKEVQGVASLKDLGEEALRDYYLTRLAQNYSAAELVHQDARRARSAQLVFETLIRKYDPHPFNHANVDGGIPVTFDHDTGFNSLWWPDDVDLTLYFYRQYKEHLSGETIEGANRRASAEDRIRPYLVPEGYNRDQIDRSIAEFEALDSRTLAQEAGYEGEDLKKVVLFLEKSKAYLRADVEGLFKMITGSELRSAARPEPVEGASLGAFPRHLRRHFECDIWLWAVDMDGTAAPFGKRIRAPTRKILSELVRKDNKAVLGVISSASVPAVDDRMTKRLARRVQERLYVYGDGALGFSPMQHRDQKPIFSWSLWNFGAELPGIYAAIRRALTQVRSQFNKALASPYSVYLIEDRSSISLHFSMDSERIFQAVVKAVTRNLKRLGLAALPTLWGSAKSKELLISFSDKDAALLHLASRVARKRKVSLPEVLSHTAVFGDDFIDFPMFPLVAHAGGTAVLVKPFPPGEFKRGVISFARSWQGARGLRASIRTYLDWKSKHKQIKKRVSPAAASSLGDSSLPALSHGPEFVDEARRLFSTAGIITNSSGNWSLAPGTPVYSHFLRFFIEELKALPASLGKDGKDTVVRLIRFLEGKIPQARWDPRDVKEIKDIFQGQGTSVVFADHLRPEDPAERIASQLLLFEFETVHTQYVKLERFRADRPDRRKIRNNGWLLLDLGTGNLIINLDTGLASSLGAESGSLVPPFGSEDAASRFPTVRRMAIQIFEASREKHEQGELKHEGIVDLWRLTLMENFSVDEIIQGMREWSEMRKDRGGFYLGFRSEFSGFDELYFDLALRGAMVGTARPELKPRFKGLVQSASENQEVRDAAARGFIHLTSEEDVPDLIYILDHPQIFIPVTREHAATRLGTFGPGAARAVPALIDVFQKEFSQENLLQGLALASLSSLMQIEPGARMNFTTESGKTESMPVGEASLSLLSSSNSTTRWNAVNAVAVANDPPAISALVRRVYEEPERQELRLYILKRLIELSPEIEIEYLTLAGEHRRVNVKEFARLAKDEKLAWHRRIWHEALDREEIGREVLDLERRKDWNAIEALFWKVVQGAGVMLGQSVMDWREVGPLVGWSEVMQGILERAGYPDPEERRVRELKKLLDLQDEKFRESEGKEASSASLGVAELLPPKLRRLLKRPIWLWAFDKDGTLVWESAFHSDPLEEETAKLLSDLVQSDPEVSLAVITFAEMRRVEEDVTRKLHPEVQDRLYRITAMNLNEEYQPGGMDSRQILFPPLSVLGERLAKLKQVLRETVHSEKMRKILQKDGISTEDLRIYPSKSIKDLESLIVRMDSRKAGEAALRAAAHVIRQKIKKANLSQDLQVALDGANIYISLANKARALRELAEKIAAKRGVSVRKVLRHTAVFGDSELDIPMLNLAAEAGGIAVWFGKTWHPHLNARVFHFSSLGPDQVRAVLSTRLEWLRKDTQLKTAGAASPGSMSGASLGRTLKILRDDVVKRLKTDNRFIGVTGASREGHWDIEARRVGKKRKFVVAIEERISHEGLRRVIRRAVVRRWGPGKKYFGMEILAKHDLPLQEGIFPDDRGWTYIRRPELVRRMASAFLEGRLNSKEEMKVFFDSAGGASLGRSLNRSSLKARLQKMLDAVSGNAEGIDQAQVAAEIHSVVSLMDRPEISKDEYFGAAQKLRSVAANRSFFLSLTSTQQTDLRAVAIQLERESIPEELFAWLQLPHLKKRHQYSPARASEWEKLLAEFYPGVTLDEIVSAVEASVARDQDQPNDGMESELSWIPNLDHVTLPLIRRNKQLKGMFLQGLFIRDTGMRFNLGRGGIRPAEWAALIHHFAKTLALGKSTSKPAPRARGQNNTRAPLVLLLAMAGAIALAGCFLVPRRTSRRGFLDPPAWQASRGPVDWPVDPEEEEAERRRGNLVPSIASRVMEVQGVTSTAHYENGILHIETLGNGWVHLRLKEGIEIPPDTRWLYLKYKEKPGMNPDVGDPGPMLFQFTDRDGNYALRQGSDRTPIERRIEELDRYNQFHLERYLLKWGHILIDSVGSVVEAVRDGENIGTFTEVGVESGAVWSIMFQVPDGSWTELELGDMRFLSESQFRVMHAARAHSLGTDITLPPNLLNRLEHDEIWFVAADKDGTTTPHLGEIDEDSADLLSEWLLRDPNVFLGMISVAEIWTLDDQVTNRLSQSVREKVYRYGSSDYEAGPMPWDPRRFFFRPLEDLGGDLEKLKNTIFEAVDSPELETLQRGRNLIDDIKLRVHRNRIELFLTAATEVASRVLKEAIQKRIREKGLPPDIQVARAGDKIYISLANKEKAIRQLAREIGQNRAPPVTEEEVLRHTIAFGNDEIDIPMLNAVARAGGIAVWFSKTRHPDLREDVFHLDVYGPRGFQAILWVRMKAMDQQSAPGPEAKATSLGEKHAYREVTGDERRDLNWSFPFQLDWDYRNALTIFRDEERKLFLVKRQDETNGRNNPKRELLAYLIGKGRVNAAEIRRISGEEVSQIPQLSGLNEAELKHYSLSRLTQSYPKEELAHQDPRKARSALLVFDTLIRRWDPHALNREEVDGIPVSFDHDSAFHPYFVDGTDGAEDFPVRYHRYLAGLDLSPRDKIEFRDRIAPWLKAESYDPEQIYRSIEEFERLEFRPLAEQAGFQGDALTRVISFLEQTRSTLRKDVEHLFRRITGKRLKKPVAASSLGETSFLDELRAAFARPIWLFAMDKDGTAIRDEWVLEEETSELFSALVRKAKKVFLAIISWSPVGAIDDEIASLLARNVRKKLYVYGENGGAFFDPEDDRTKQPRLLRSGKALNKKMHRRIERMIRRALENVRSRLEAEKGSPDQIRIFHHKTRILIYFKGLTEETRRAVASAVRTQLAKARISIEPTVTSKFIYLSSSRVDKRQAIRHLARRLAKKMSNRTRKVSAREVLRHTAVIGDSPIDVPMLNAVAEAEGVALWVGDTPPEDLDGRVILAPKEFEGPAGVRAAMRAHLDWLDQPSSRAAASSLGYFIPPSVSGLPRLPHSREFPSAAMLFLAQEEIEPRDAHVYELMPDDPWHKTAYAALLNFLIEELKSLPPAERIDLRYSDRADNPIVIERLTRFLEKKLAEFGRTGEWTSGDLNEITDVFNGEILSGVGAFFYPEEGLRHTLHLAENMTDDMKYGIVWSRFFKKKGRRSREQHNGMLTLNLNTGMLRVNLDVRPLGSGAGSADAESLGDQPSPPTPAHILRGLRSSLASYERYLEEQRGRLAPRIRQIFDNEIGFRKAVLKEIEKGGEIDAFVAEAASRETAAILFSWQLFDEIWKRLLARKGDLRARDRESPLTDIEQFQAVLADPTAREELKNLIALPVAETEPGRYAIEDQVLRELLFQAGMDEPEILDRGASTAITSLELAKGLGGHVIAVDLQEKPRPTVTPRMLARGLTFQPEVLPGGLVKFRYADATKTYFQDLEGDLSVIRDAGFLLRLSPEDHERVVAHVFHYANGSYDRFFYHQARGSKTRPNLFSQFIFRITGLHPRDWELEHAGYLYQNGGKDRSSLFSDEALLAYEKWISQMTLNILENLRALAPLAAPDEPSRYDVYGRTVPSVRAELIRAVLGGLADSEEKDILTHMLEDILIISPWTRDEEYHGNYYQDHGVYARHELAWNDVGQNTIIKDVGELLARLEELVRSALDAKVSGESLGGSSSVQGNVLPNREELFTYFWSQDGLENSFGEKLPEALETYWTGVFGSIRNENPRARILDVGTGKLTVLQLAQKVPGQRFDLHGADFAEIPSNEDAPGIHFHRANIERLPDREPFLSESFDVVTSMYGIEYTNIERTLREILRVLRPGGKAFFLMHHKDSLLVTQAKQAAGIREIIFRDSRILTLVRAYFDGPTDQNLDRVHSAIDEFRKRSNDYAATQRNGSRLIRDQHLATEFIWGLLKTYALGNEDRARKELDLLERDMSHWFELKRWLVEAAARFGQEGLEKIIALMRGAGFKVERVGLRNAGESIMGWVVEIHKPAISEAGEPAASSLGEKKGPASQPFQEAARIVQALERGNPSAATQPHLFTLIAALEILSERLDSGNLFAGPNSFRGVRGRARLFEAIEFMFALKRTLANQTVWDRVIRKLSDTQVSHQRIALSVLKMMLEKNPALATDPNRDQLTRIMESRQEDELKSAFEDVLEAFRLARAAPAIGTGDRISTPVPRRLRQKRRFLGLSLGQGSQPADPELARLALRAIHDMPLTVSKGLLKRIKGSLEEHPVDFLRQSWIRWSPDFAHLNRKFQEAIRIIDRALNTESLTYREAVKIYHAVSLWNDIAPTLIKIYQASEDPGIRARVPSLQKMMTDRERDSEALKNTWPRFVTYAAVMRGETKLKLADVVGVVDEQKTVYVMTPQTGVFKNLSDPRKTLFFPEGSRSLTRQLQPGWKVLFISRGVSISNAAPKDVHEFSGPFVTDESFTTDQLEPEDRATFQGGSLGKAKRRIVLFLAAAAAIPACAPGREGGSRSGDSSSAHRRSTLDYLINYWREAVQSPENMQRYIEGYLRRFDYAVVDRTWLAALAEKYVGEEGSENEARLQFELNPFRLKQLADEGKLDWLPRREDFSTAGRLPQRGDEDLFAGILARIKDIAVTGGAELRYVRDGRSDPTLWDGAMSLRFAHAPFGARSRPEFRAASVDMELEEELPVPAGAGFLELEVEGNFVDPIYLDLRDSDGNPVFEQSGQNAILAKMEEDFRRTSWTLSGLDRELASEKIILSPYSADPGQTRRIEGPRLSERTLLRFPVKTLRRGIKNVRFVDPMGRNASWQGWGIRSLRMIEGPRRQAYSLGEKREEEKSYSVLKSPDLGVSLLLGSVSNTLKDILRSRAGLDENQRYVVVLPPSLFDGERAFGELEFLVYFNAFIKNELFKPKGRRVQVVGTKEQLEALTEYLQHTLLGPKWELREKVYPWVTEEQRRFFINMREHFRPRPGGVAVEADGYIETIPFDSASGEARVPVRDDQKNITAYLHVGPIESEGGMKKAYRVTQEIAGATKDLGRLDIRYDFPEPVQHEVPPGAREEMLSGRYGFATTWLGTSDGFDPHGDTTSMILWLEGQGIWVDPSYEALRYMNALGLTDDDVPYILLTHIHQDHDGGVLKRILMGKRVKLIASRLVFEEAITKANLLLKWVGARMNARDFVTHVPLEPGSELALKLPSGREAVFQNWWNLHPIPTNGFSVRYESRDPEFLDPGSSPGSVRRGSTKTLRRLSYFHSSDTQWDPEKIREMVAAGRLTEAQAQEQMERFMDAEERPKYDRIHHEAGVPPIHTPLSVLRKLSEETRKRMRVYHVSDKRVREEGEGLTKARAFETEVLIPSDKERREAYILSVLTGNALLRRKEMQRKFLQSAAPGKFAAGQEIVVEGERIRVATLRGVEKLIDQGPEVAQPDGRVYFIVDGYAGVYVGGRKVAELGPGTHFGDWAVINGDPRKATVRAEVPLEVFSLSADEFRELFGRHPGILQNIRRGQDMIGPLQEWIRKSSYRSFRDLLNSALILLTERTHPEIFSAGSVILREGDEARDRVFLIQEGEVEVFAGPAKKKIADRGPGDILGEIAILRNMKRTATVRAKTQVKVLVLNARDLLKFLARYPVIRFRMEEEIEERLRAVNGGSLGRAKPISRIARLIQENPVIDRMARANQEAGGGYEGFIRLPLETELIVPESPGDARTLLEFLKQLQAPAALQTRRRIFDERALPEDPGLLIQFLRDHPDIRYTLLTLESPEAVGRWKADRALPENFEIVPVASANALGATVHKLVSRDRIPAGFVSENPALLDRIGIRQSLIRVRADSRDPVLHDAAVMVTAERLLKELAFSDLIRVYQGEDLASEGLWTQLVARLRARTLLLAAA